jgi:hypothetical protein
LDELDEGKLSKLTGIATLHGVRHVKSYARLVLKYIQLPQIIFVVFTLMGPAAVAQEIAVTNLSTLDLKYAQAEATTYHGEQALKLTEKESDQMAVLAVVKNLIFRNGTIDIDVSGAPARGTFEAARGFIGLAFRMQSDRVHYEAFYVRPTNGRADDQLRRNHSTQYISEPDWTWQRLRNENPGLYESYADMQPGEWLHLRIVVAGTNASLYVGNASQPSLLVHDLKMGEKEGAVALWIGPGTEGYFRNLKITK